MMNYSITELEQLIKMLKLNGVYKFKNEGLELEMDLPAAPAESLTPEPVAVDPQEEYAMSDFELHQSLSRL